MLFSPEEASRGFSVVIAASFSPRLPINVPRPYTLPPMSAPPRVPPVPAVLRLVQMMVLGRWRATGEELYREVADLTDAGPGKEIVVSGSGEGETSEWLAAKTGASITG